MRRRWPHLLASWVLVCVLSPFPAAVSAAGQSSPLEKSFEASSVEVQKTLQSLQPSSGRLPILDGFVAASDSPLERYQRGYYQFSIQVIPHGSNQSIVRVSAKITAWYAGETPAASGYRVLPSNGRLEGDFLDRLNEALSAKGSPDKSDKLTAKSDVVQPNRSTVNKQALPDNLASNSTIAFPPTSTNAPLLPSREQSLATKASPSADDQRVQRLAQEARNLEDILHNQAHPQNMVSIKQSHTPVYDRPLDEAKVLFFADANDEFQIVDTAGSWVHVQVSGISRGWIKRTQIELPGSPGVSDTALTTNNSVEQPASFGPIREETSIFPGNWSALRGKTVKVIWVQPAPSNSPSQSSKIELAKSVFRKSYPQLSQSKSNLAGVVVVFDSEDGGMAAATAASLQQWNAGHLSDNAFWKQCWLDPADAFQGKQ